MFLTMITIMIIRGSRGLLLAVLVSIIINVVQSCDHHHCDDHQNCDHDKNCDHHNHHFRYVAARACSWLSQKAHASFPSLQVIYTYIVIEVGPQLRDGGPSGQLDFVN